MDQCEIIGELKEGEPVSDLMMEEFQKFTLENYRTCELAARERELHRHFDPDSAMELTNKLTEMLQGGT